MFWWCHSVTLTSWPVYTIHHSSTTHLEVILSMHLWHKSSLEANFEAIKQFCKWCCFVVKQINRECGLPRYRMRTCIWQRLKKTPQLFYTCRSYMSQSQVPISTPCQRRFWTASRALCLFVFCKKGQLPRQCQSTPGSLICESLTVGLLPAQLVRRCVCVCERASV